MEDEENILLLSCCAPCSCAVIEKMANAGDKFTVLFYNPNINPASEYEKRKLENLRLCEKYNIPFIDLEYDNDRWQKLTKGMENEPEQGNRCSICFYMRIKRAMEYAKENNFTAVGSVLGVSRYKNLDQVNKAAEKASAEVNFPYTQIEGRKNGMQDLQNLIIKEMKLYHQNYCGCKPKDNK